MHPCRWLPTRRFSTFFAPLRLSSRERACQPWLLASGCDSAQVALITGSQNTLFIFQHQSSSLVPSQQQPSQQQPAPVFEPIPIGHDHFLSRPRWGLWPVLWFCCFMLYYRGPPLLLMQLSSLKNYRSWSTPYLTPLPSTRSHVFAFP